jgi:hypothetical protein
MAGHLCQRRWVCQFRHSPTLVTDRLSSQRVTGIAPPKENVPTTSYSSSVSPGWVERRWLGQRGLMSKKCRLISQNDKLMVLPQFGRTLHDALGRPDESLHLPHFSGLLSHPCSLNT